MMLECLVVYPFKIVIYTGWWIFPYSPVFYVAALSLAYVYYQAIEKKFVVKKEPI